MSGNVLSQTQKIEFILLRHLSQREVPSSIYELTKLLHEDPEEAFASILRSIYSMAGRGLLEVSSTEGDDGTETAVAVTQLGKAVIRSEDLRSGAYIRR